MQGVPISAEAQRKNNVPFRYGAAKPGLGERLFRWLFSRCAIRAALVAVVREEILQQTRPGGLISDSGDSTGVSPR